MKSLLSFSSVVLLLFFSFLSGKATTARENEKKNDSNLCKNFPFLIFPKQKLDSIELALMVEI